MRTFPAELHDATQNTGFIQAMPNLRPRRAHVAAVAAARRAGAYVTVVAPVNAGAQ